MSAQIIDGTEIAREIRSEIAREVSKLSQEHHIVPGLATILVGDDPASRVYVKSKARTCDELGIHSEQYSLPVTTSEGELKALIDQLNCSPNINGILVQLPLPPHIREAEIILSVDPEKDVDGFHPLNLGRLMLGQPLYKPCTPAGIQELLIRSGIELGGANVVILGRSNIVGKPLANILMQKANHANATVTVCHTGTRNIASHTRQADIIIAAMGKPKAVTADMVKDGAVVIDVGVNRVGQTPEGKAILLGDVDFAAVKEKASAITPVPGGVGPMTIAMLMANTLLAAKRAAGLI